MELQACMKDANDSTGFLKFFRCKKGYLYVGENEILPYQYFSHRLVQYVSTNSAVNNINLKMSCESQNIEKFAMMKQSNMQKSREISGGNKHKSKDETIPAYIIRRAE